MNPIPLTETQMAELFRLRAENAALKEQVDKKQATIDTFVDGSFVASNLFSEQQAHIAYLKDFIFDYVDVEPNNELAMAKYHKSMNQSSTDALREHDAKLVERIADFVENKFDLCGDELLIADKIRKGEFE